MAPLPPRDFPSSRTLHPVILPDGSVHKGTVFLRNAVSNPHFIVGEYTYASAFNPPADWGARLAPYLFPQSPETLTIGKYGQIADGVTFITASANHRYDGFSSFPFSIFLDMDRKRPSMPDAGPDTVVGDDVWIGQGATILPGARIGTGCIIGASAVVSGEIAPYTIVAGNPARAVRQRFDDDTINALLDIAWWNWPVEHVVQHEAAICGADIAALRDAAPIV